MAPMPTLWVPWQVRNRVRIEWDMKPADRNQTVISGRTALFVRFALLVGSSVFVLGCAEILLTFRVLPLSDAATRYVFGCYEPSQPGRYIYTSITSLQLGLHRPHFAGDCYFSGHFWRHQSDAFGWRNPTTWDAADVVLLGDSMIYGHGVNEEQTTAHFLRRQLGQTVVNLGITGGSPVHYLAYLRNFALPLEPRVIVVFFFGNDLEDIRATRPLEEIETFVLTGEGRETQIFQRAELMNQLRLPGKQQPGALDGFATYRLLEFAVRAWEPSRPAPRVEPRQTNPADPEQAERPAVLPPPPDEANIRELENRNELRIAYLRRAMAMMAESSRNAHATLVVAHLGKLKDSDWLFQRLLTELSEEHDIYYFDTPVLDGPDRLPFDGHLSEAGHRRLAEALAAFLRERALL